MENQNTKTPEQIEDLKRQWKNDPCWDIEETEGFEAYKEELKKFSDEYSEKLREQRTMREAAEVKRFLSLKLLESIHVDGIKYTKVPSGWIAISSNSGYADEGYVSHISAMCFIPDDHVRLGEGK